jgi:hypothetical protein
MLQKPVPANSGTPVACCTVGIQEGHILENIEIPVRAILGQALITNGTQVTAHSLVSGHKLQLTMWLCSIIGNNVKLE